MKRKVNRVGRNTLTVSLPSKWAKERSISQGDEVDIIEQDNQLIISKENIAPKQKSIEIDVSGQDIMLHRVIAAIYKAGYDEVIIKYSTPEELEKIQNRLDRNLSEFDIAEYKQNQVIVRSLSKLDPSQFDIIYRKIFYNLNDICNDINIALKANDNDGLKNIILRDKVIDKYTDFCRRLMNKGFYSNFNRPHAAYYIIEQTEIIADMIKDLAENLRHRQSQHKQTIECFNILNQFIAYFVNLLLDFNLLKAEKFGSFYDKSKKRIYNALNNSEKELLMQIFPILNILDATFEMKGALFTDLL